MKIWIATGGTGGHVFPALSVADKLDKLGHKVIISSDLRVKDMISKNKPINSKLFIIWASGVGGKNLLFKLFSLFKIAISTVYLFFIFLIKKPNRVVAFGGYSSVPAIFVAHLLKIPTLLHEQNAAIGRANKFALKWVKVLMTSFKNVEGVNNKSVKIVYTGLPVRDEILKLSNSPLKMKSEILITGGSLGAKILDDIVPIAIENIKNKKVFITHQTRPENTDKLRKFYLKAKIKANVVSFINDIATVIEKSDLIISRGGASTVVELQTIGRPAIIVPLSINPDQMANAKSFEKTGGAIAIEQSKFTVKWLSSTISELLNNPNRLKKMSEKAYIKNNATELIIQQILK